MSSMTVRSTCRVATVPSANREWDVHGFGNWIEVGKEKHFLFVAVLGLCVWRIARDGETTTATTTTTTNY